MPNVFTSLITAHLLRQDLLLALAPSGIALVACQGWGRQRQQRLLAQWHEPQLRDLPAPEQAARIEQQLQQMLGEVAAQIPGKAVHVVLADEWARYFLVTPPNNAQSMADCEAAAMLRFQYLFGEPPQGWQIQARWDARLSFLACALPQGLLTLVQKACAKQQRQIVSMKPNLLAMLEYFGPQIGANQWLLQIAPDHIQIVAIAEGQVIALQNGAINADFWRTPDALLAWLTREALRLQLPLPSALQLCGKLPANWQHQKMGQISISALPALTLAPNLAASPALDLLHGVLT